MFFARTLKARPATPADRSAVQALCRAEERVHMHLDWRPVEDWLGEQPFVLVERGGRGVAALACPPDLPDVAWVRLLALADGLSALEAWALLWPVAQAELRRRQIPSVAALNLEPWSAELYEQAGLTRTHDVVVLSRTVGRAAPLMLGHTSTMLKVRRATPAEYATIIQIDTAAFTPPWQLSSAMLRLAIAQADYVTVAEALNGELVGYQLSTASRGNSHLARLASLPRAQGQGVGSALMADLIAHYEALGGRELTVNTQHNNHASLAVYQKFGYSLTGARFPVYQGEV